MFYEERLDYIIKTLDKKNRVSVASLSEVLGVSEVTIRKDLKDLEERGLLKRTHGGAIKLSKNVKELPIARKKSKNLGSKEKIAKKASELIEDSFTIFLDSGTTTRMLIDYMGAYEGVTVITYDLEIAYILRDYPEIRTYILGGYIENTTNTSFSIEGYENLSKFHADISFIGADAYDDMYVYSTSENKGKLKSKMIENSKVSVLMADTSKYPSTGLYAFSKTEDFDYLISK